MFNKLFSLAALMLIAMLLTPSNGHAQSLTTLEQCKQGFYAALDAWDADVPVRTGWSVCEANKGAMHVHLQGNDGDGHYWNFNARLYKAADHSKWCSVEVSRHPDIGGNYEGIFIYVQGKDAAAWNKFLKSDGCSDALGLLP